MIEEQAPVPTDRPVLETHRTGCCIVGGGPAGVMLSYLLTRQGVPVTLLEAQKSFDREFRGDTICPAVLEVLDQIGLADDLLRLPHAKIDSLSVDTDKGPLRLNDFRSLPTKFPYILVLPQEEFIQFMIERLRTFSNFHMILGGNVRELIEEDGLVRGVRYRRDGEAGEVHAALTVGADGRFSRMRTLLGAQVVQTSPPMDVMWFRLPRLPDDPASANLTVRFGRGYYFALTDRFKYWQIAYVIPKGTFKEVRNRGIEAFQESIAACMPEFRDRVASLQDWSQVSNLSVQSNRVRRWYKPGALLIGDAAHVMSSVGGVGINCAIQDAVVAANVLSEPFRRGVLRVRDLAAVQRQREWVIRVTQFIQAVAQKQVIARALDPNRPFSLPLSLRIPWLQRMSMRFTAFGVWPVRVRNA